MLAYVGRIHNLKDLKDPLYKGTSLIRKRTPLGPCWPMDGVIRGVIGGWAFSCGRGTPVVSCEEV